LAAEDIAEECDMDDMDDIEDGAGIRDANIGAFTLTELFAEFNLVLSFALECIVDTLPLLSDADTELELELELEEK
jgi:hypothetical protein